MAGAEVLVAAVASVAVALAELLILEAGFRRRVRAELLELERAEAELDSERGATHRICRLRHRRLALQSPADRRVPMSKRQPTDV